MGCGCGSNFSGQEKKACTCGRNAGGDCQCNKSNASGSVKSRKMPKKYNASGNLQSRIKTHKAKFSAFMGSGRTPIDTKKYGISDEYAGEYNAFDGNRRASNINQNDLRVEF